MKKPSLFGSIVSCLAFISLVFPLGFHTAHAAGPVSPALSTLVVSTNSLEANNQAWGVAYVYARDASNLPLSGRKVVLSSTIAGTVFTPDTFYTDVNGFAQFTIKSSRVGNAQISASIDDTSINQKSQVNFYYAGTAVSAVQSSVMASKTSAFANGSDPVTVTATAKDAYGNPLAGKGLTFFWTVNGSPSILSTITNTSGQAALTFTPTTSQTIVAYAEVGGVIFNQATIQFTSTYPYGTSFVSPTQSTVFVSPSIVTLNGVQTITATVYAKNASGQTLANKPVQISTNLPFTTSPSNPYTDGAGTASVNIKPLTIGSMTLTVRIDGVELVQKPVIQVQSAAVNCSLTPGSRVKLPDDKNSATQDDSAVYYVSSDCKRHAFSNVRVYYTWFSDFTGIQTISPSLLASLPLGRNITYRPGAKMIKFPSVPKVYMVGKGGVLHWVPTEWVATQYFGTDWKNKIEDISEAFYGDYVFGNDIFNVWDYNVGNEYTGASLEN